MLEDIEKKISELESSIQEVNEALEAGRNVQAALERVMEFLKSAKGWGLWDMLGGGFLATAVKHSKLDKAKEEIQKAQKKLSILNRELSDVNLSADIGIEVGSFITFADYFFDGIMADWLVQGKINDGLEKARETYDQVDDILRRLRSRQNELNEALNKKKQELELYKNRD